MRKADSLGAGEIAERLELWGVASINPAAAKVKMTASRNGNPNARIYAYRAVFEPENQLRCGLRDPEASNPEAGVRLAAAALLVNTRDETAREWIRLQLCGQDVDFLDFRGLREQLRRFGHQRSGHFAIQVRLAASLVWEGVENSEGRWPHANAKPCHRGGFLLDKRETVL